jgi:hypothetical protein
VVFPGILLPRPGDHLVGKALLLRHRERRALPEQQDELLRGRPRLPGHPSVWFDLGLQPHSRKAHSYDRQNRATPPSAHNVSFVALHEIVHRSSSSGSIGGAHFMVRANPRRPVRP